ncbi:hypothetical protein LGM85_30220 [Burkholderia multivorans]|uniref:hypothetical protein n=1 Tax=Burkholderia multivorans TaxID=87883 RepID=UPI00201AB2C9|nr:hypothetical protein [Burkholderia multivorans]MCA8488201.1 hypothetical protein [Burkholderia multivorans]MCL4663303.1 hypothetical protein [Burkholderia multivorans]MCO1414985.1 hypothetical protein [Burkholderia multivorans]MCO1448928.1 hypothetical protein [Burkholderia multivorans]MCO8315274.1 hypothetical protein [Burkholderia multivorans]
MKEKLKAYAIRAGKLAKQVVSYVGHLILWTRPKEHVSLLRVLVAGCGYGLGIAAWTLLPARDHESQKFFLEIVVFVFAVISVFEISDGVVLGRDDLDTLKSGGQAAIELVPKLLVDASQKCKVGLVFAIYGWLADLAVKYLL